MKKLKRETRFYIFMLAATIFLVVLSVYQARVNLYDPDMETARKKISIERVEQLNEMTRDYYFSEDTLEPTYSGFMFYANHKFVRVYADEKLIYANENKHTLLGNTTGAVWYFVEIPQGTKEVRVQVEAAYSIVKDEVLTFYQGNGVEMFGELLRESILSLFVSGTVIILGIFMLSYWFVMSGKVKVGKALLFLGFFAVLMGTWSVGETNIVMLLVGNHVALSFMAFVLLMLMQIPFVLFAYHFMEARDKWLHRIVIGIQCSSMILQLTLHFSGIAELKETAVVTHVTLVLAVLYYLYTVVSKYRRDGLTKKIKVSLVGFLVLAIAATGDIYTYYMGTRMVDAFGRIGILCYIALLGYEVSSNSLATIEAGRKAAIYKELAMKDILTGTFNRNAYHKDTYARKNLKDVLVLTMDLNDLKYCNDTFGHAAGDRYIVDSAAIITNVFGKYGKVYRIGGDEFCVLAENGSMCNAERLIEQMRAEEIRYNASSENVILALACGYATFDPSKDEDIEDTRSRADAMMYENKRNLKIKIV